MKLKFGILKGAGYISLLLFIYWLWVILMPFPLQQTEALMIKQGDSARTVSSILYRRHLTKDPISFEILSRIMGRAHQLQAGEYQLIPGDNGWHLLHRLSMGKVWLHAVTLIPGFTLKDVRKTLQQQPALNDNVQHMTSGQLRKALNSDYLEGAFYPDTYCFPRHILATDVLCRANKRLLEMLSSLWEQRATVPYTQPWQAVIVASLIEKETALSSEKAKIAAVIVNRLRKHMRLQIDASVIFGLGLSYHGKLTRADLRKDMPYNLYRHKGLPPTAIGLVTRGDLYAALHPANTQALYYVSKGDGSHVFSTTLQAHDSAIKQYLLKADS